jgi:hypothetical protein
MEKCFAFFEAQTEFLSVIQMNFSFKGLITEENLIKCVAFVIQATENTFSHGHILNNFHCHML